MFAAATMDLRVPGWASLRGGHADERHWEPSVARSYSRDGGRVIDVNRTPDDDDDDPPRCYRKRSIDGASGRDRFHQRCKRPRCDPPTPPRPTIHPTLFDVEGMIGRRWNSKGKVKSMPGFDRRSKRAGPFPSTPQFSSLRHSHSAKTDRPSDIVRSRRIDGDIRRFVYRAASREGGTRTRGGEGGRGCVAPRRCARTMTMGSWSDSDSPVGPPIPIRAVERNCGNDPPPR